MSLLPYCPPQGTGALASVFIFAAWAEANRSEWQEDAEFGLLKAFATAWPCR
jgi:hypothetical protein